MIGKRFALILCAAALATLFTAGCKDDSTSTYGSNTGGNPSGNAVTIAGMAFGPGSLTITRMTTVTWKNNDGMSHTATSDANTWTTGTIAPGASASVAFNTAGTFTYHCAIHSSMTGTIIVH